jgi:beta-ureidopropionase / N-carbamoyl-L-amino-acid hydrolase
VTTRPLTSGAGHDAAWIARVAPAAMIFVPSRAGRSHTPDEWTDNDAIARGAAVLFEAVFALDARPESAET